MSLGRVFDIAGAGMNAQSIRLNTTASNMANAQSASSSTDEVYRARHPVFAAKSLTEQQFIQRYWQSQSLQQPEAGYQPSIAEGSQVGVQVMGIVESDAPLQRRYEPNHPEADAEGYVFYPNVNVVEEMTNMISASRSFQTNVEVMNSAKQMIQKALTLGQ